MSNVNDYSSSSGVESHASNSSNLSSDHKSTMHLYLYRNEQQDNCGYDVPSFQSALQLLNHNDPNFKFVKILFNGDDHQENTALKSVDEVKSIGRAIAKSTTIENLKIEQICHQSIEFKDCNNILLLLEEMKGNRSLQHVELEALDLNKDEFHYSGLDENGGLATLDVGEKILNALKLFLENNPNLESFVMKYCQVHHDAVRRLMAALISRDSPLGSFAMDSCGIDDEGVKEMSSSLKDDPKMTTKKLSLNSNNEISDIGCYFLSKLIGNDECKLEEISLIGIESIGLTGIRSIVFAAADREVPLKKIDFPAVCSAETPDELQEFVEIFSVYPGFVPKCIEINFEHFEVSRDVLQALGNMLARRSSPIESLCFSLASIEHDGVLTFLRVFLENPIAIPKSISISNNLYTGENLGDLHLVLGRLLRSRLCSLEELTLSDNGQISDDEMIDIATSLDGNTTLKSLDIFDRISSARVVNSLSALLCDATTIMSTYNSNHTLEYLGIHVRDPKVSSYLELNGNVQDKGIVATAKIIEVHFARNFQLGNFDSMKSPLLAQIVSFVNRGFHVWNEAFNLESDGESEGGEEKEIANNNLTVNFLMVRNIPAFFDYTKPR